MRGGPHFTNTERELFNDVINEVDRACLSMLLIDFKGTNSGRIINCGELEPAHFLATFSFEVQELDVYLDVMPWNLFLIPFGVQFTHTCASGQSIETVAFEDAVNPCIRDFDAVIARQVPDDPN